MALTLLGSQIPCFGYHPFDPAVVRGPWNSYGYDPAHPPLYDEHLTQITSFYYLSWSGGGSLAAGDYFLAAAWFGQCNWPGWSAALLAWDAATGRFVKRLSLNLGYTMMCSRATATINGEVYGIDTYGTSQVRQVPGDTLGPASWSYDFSSLPPSNPALTIAFFNRARNLLIGVGNPGLAWWDLSGSPAVLLGKLAQPNRAAYICYEDQNNLWMVTIDGLVAKANYLNAPRWELLSAVAAPTSETLGYYCAWDAARRRLVILRWLPDAGDGACRLQLEFYRPLYLPTLLTEPVPVTGLQAGAAVDFVAHLIGDAGEGASPYNVEAVLGGTPVGVLKTPQAATELNGAVTFRYQAPDEGCSELVQLSVPVPDGAG